MITDQILEDTVKLLQLPVYYFIILDPSIYFHSAGGISVIKETPAHVGFRHETDYITSVNKASGKVEQHLLKRRIPITGIIQEVFYLFNIFRLKQLKLIPPED